MRKFRNRWDDALLVSNNCSGRALKKNYRKKFPKITDRSTHVTAERRNCINRWLAASSSIVQRSEFSLYCKTCWNYILGQKANCCDVSQQPTCCFHIEIIQFGAFSFSFSHAGREKWFKSFMNGSTYLTFTTFYRCSLSIWFQLCFVVESTAISGSHNTWFSTNATSQRSL